MFIKEDVKAKDIKVESVDINNYMIKAVISNKEYTFSLLNTGISYMKEFCLDYCNNSKFFNLETGEVTDSIFG